MNELEQTVIPVLRSVVFDCPDSLELAKFYGALLGWTPEPDPDDAAWVDLRSPAGGVKLAFQAVANYQPPQWPSARHSQQMHLDLTVDDLDTAHARALGLGARVLDDQGLTKSGFRVYADPVGHPFCLVKAQ